MIANAKEINNNNNNNNNNNKENMKVKIRQQKRIGIIVRYIV